ncbi:MAG: purine-binding chemotaxis protein CheW [Deltaproteobacteria bacterium]|nr:purine-binding chemotaxis protein CheW [Deltaproteobacteria bacterium]
MNSGNHLVVFTLDDQRYGLHLSPVERIARVVDITPLPKAPDIVVGVVNVHGQIVPVLDIRKRFRLPERAVRASDRLLIAQTPRRTVAFLVDMVSEVIELSEETIIAAAKIVPGMEYIEGVAKLKDGLILIHDIDKFLSLDEEKVLSGALG